LGTPWRSAPTASSGWWSRPWTNSWPSEVSGNMPCLIGQGRKRAARSSMPRMTRKRSGSPPNGTGINRVLRLFHCMVGRSDEKIAGFENELELENPGMDLDVSIYQDGGVI